MAADFVFELEKLLDEYDEHVKQETEKVFTEVATEAAQKLKQTSPKSKGRRRHYATGWAMKKNGERTWVVYNKTMPGLTHLLEKGHATVNGRRVAPQIHIAPVEEWANREVVARLERDL